MLMRCNSAMSGFVCSALTSDQFATVTSTMRGTKQAITIFKPTPIVRKVAILLAVALLATIHQAAGQSEQQTTKQQGDGADQHGASSSAHHHQAASKVVKCTRQSIVLARQTLMHELDQMNDFNSIWFNDLAKDELIEEQRQSLSKIVMSGAGTQLLNGDGQPLVEIESSYFRPIGSGQHPNAVPTSRSMAAGALPLDQQQQQQQQSHLGLSNNLLQPINIKLIRRHQQDRCYLHTEKDQFTYVVSLSLGPIEHNLDVVYNLPRELRISQPVDWTYGQIRMHIPRMNYEVSLKQAASYKLNGSGISNNNGQQSHGCPLEIADVTYLSGGPSLGPQTVSIETSGLAVTNQTMLQLERLFDDYTRPTVSSRLRQMLKFYLNSKTLPLSA